MTPNYQGHIAILGMGSTGLSVARFLLRHHITCEAFDEHKVNLPDDLNIPLHIGKFTAQALSSFSRIIVSPGVNWHHPELVSLRESGIPMHGDLDVFLEYFHKPLLAVTGTNGKTTTTSLIALLLETLPGGIEAGGNIGTPMLDLLEGKPPARAVLELSSFQLERCAGIHPQWAVLLNIQPDHADMHSSPEAYEAAKLRLFANQQAGDTAVLPSDIRWNDMAWHLGERGVKVHRFGIAHDHDVAADQLACGILHTSGDTMLFWTQNGHRIMAPQNEIPARGTHQHLNLAVAAQAAADFGVHEAVIREATSTFRGLPHRIQHIAFQHDRDWFNDSKATNPAAASAALTSFEKVVWICGGLLKGLSLDEMASAVKAHVQHALIIGKDSAPFVSLMESTGVPFTVCKTIDKAVQRAAGMSGHAPVLLSPAAASMDQFQNYAERGESFRKAVQQLGGKS